MQLYTGTRRVRRIPCATPLHERKPLWPSLGRIAARLLGVAIMGDLTAARQQRVRGWDNASRSLFARSSRRTSRRRARSASSSAHGFHRDWRSVARRRSKPACYTRARSSSSSSHAGVVKLADARDSKSRGGHPPCGFDSHLRHQVSNNQIGPRRRLPRRGIVLGNRSVCARLSSPTLSIWANDHVEHQP